MAVARVTYCSREEVTAALDVAATAYATARVDRAIEAASENVDSLCHRRFWPQAATRYFDWPDLGSPTPWRLWLEDNELVSVSTLVAGGVTVPPANYFLRRSDRREEAPYTHVEINLASSSAFAAGPTKQRAVAVTGVYAGCPADSTPAGATAEVLDASETGVDVTDSAAVGVGHLIRVDDERMLVTGKSMLTTGQTLQTALTASAANTTVAVTTGSAFAPGETVLLDAERMLVQDIAGNSLTVRRAYDGSVLATHAGSTIYAPRTLTVVRPAAGTTAATHSTGAPVTRHVPPPLVRDLTLAYAVNQLLQETAGYARVAGTGENAREFTGRGVAAIEADCYQRHGRKARVRAV